MVWISELPSAQALPVELLPPTPPSADNPELCAELDDVGDHELSYKTTKRKGNNVNDSSQFEQRGINSHF